MNKSEQSNDVITLTYATYARASKVFEHFYADGFAVAMCKGKEGKGWRIVMEVI
jgi:hypothetical protein